MCTRERETGPHATVMANGLLINLLRWLVCVCLFARDSAWGQPQAALLSMNQGTFSSGSALSMTSTVPSSTSLLVVGVVVLPESALPMATAVTWMGQTLTLAQTLSDAQTELATDAAMANFYLVAPQAGTGTLAITLPGSSLSRQLSLVSAVDE